MTGFRAENKGFDAQNPTFQGWDSVFQSGFVQLEMKPCSMGAILPGLSVAKRVFSNIFLVFILNYSFKICNSLRYG